MIRFGLLICEHAMRILHLVHRYFPEQGGAEHHMRRISQHLAAKGHSVTVVTSDAGDFARFWQPKARRIVSAESHDDTIRIIRHPIHHLPLSPLTFPAMRRLQWLLSRSRVVPLPILRRLGRFTPRLPTLWEWASTTDEQLNLVAGMTITLDQFAAAGQHLAKRVGAPFVCYPLAHLGTGPHAGQDSLSRFYTLRHQNDVVTKADLLVAQTATERDFYVERGLPSEKTIVAGPGIELASAEIGNADRFRTTRQLDTPIVLSVGRPSAEKGTLQTIAAARQLWQTGQQFTLVLIGNAAPEVAKAIGQLPSAMQHNVRTLGHVPDATKWDALAAANVFAMPSRTDSFGIAYLEAWLYKTPVIAADAWGVTDVVKDGVNGLVVPFGDTQQMANSLRMLLQNPTLAQQLGENGFATAQQHSWEQKVELVESAYLRLYDGRRIANSKL